MARNQGWTPWADARADAESTDEHIQADVPSVWIMESGESGEGGYITGVYADRELARADFIALAAQMCVRFCEAGPDVAEHEADGRLKVEVHCDRLTLTPWPVSTVSQLPAGMLGRVPASCGHPADEDGECSCSWWPERAPAQALDSGAEQGPAPLGEGPQDAARAQAAVIARLDASPDNRWVQ